MEFRVLGPVEVRADGAVRSCDRPQQGIVLAALLVDAGRPVPAEVLIDRVWGSDPPDRARRSLQTHIARVRRLLLDANGSADGVLLTRRSGGYVLDVDPRAVDLHRFLRQLDRASAPNADPRQRATQLRDALRMWTAEPLSGLTGAWVEQCRGAWRQRRLSATIGWVRAELALGNAEPVIGPLTEELLEHPLVEPLTVELMRALYAVGRGSEALHRYELTRQRLADELGSDPGLEMREVHQAILRGESGVPAARRADTPASPSATSPTASVPAQLPAGPRTFTGRQDEIDRLEAIHDPATCAATTIAAVSGTAGVGKTALALHWAHRARTRFPDGQLYVDLRGYDPQQPMEAGDALARFLTALGVPDHEIPLDVDDRAARYRTALAGRRMLIVLDNASAPDQVRPLLPGTGGCAVVVTSRDRLQGLVAVDGAERIDLELLPRADAVALLRRLIGERVDADQATATSLTELCARLPLALRVAAERAAAQPGTDLGELVDELSDQHRRLDLLDAGGDPRAAVAAVFSWSLRRLPADAARMFGLLGLHPGPELSVHAAAALADTDLVRARAMLQALDRAHLVRATGGGRYAMHDLLRAYAARRSADDASAPDALRRLLAFYVGTAASAMDGLFPTEKHYRPNVAAPQTPAPDLGYPAAARAWLDAERPCLIAIGTYAATHGYTADAVRLSNTLFRYLTETSYTDALAVHAHALQAARQAGDEEGETGVLLALGAAYSQVGRQEPARRHLERALTLARRSGSVTDEARALGAIGVTYGRLGRFGDAPGYLIQALALFRRSGDSDGAARALVNLGLVEQRLGRNDDAAQHHREALALYQQVGNRMGEASALNALGVFEQRHGRYESAVEHLERALACYRELGNPRAEAGVLDDLGTISLRRGRPREAAALFEQALVLFHDVGEPDGEAWALNGLGEAAFAADRPDEAVRHHLRAGEIAADVEAYDQSARAEAGLGSAYDALGDAERARAHLECALDLYVDLGLPEADGIRERLAALGAWT